MMYNIHCILLSTYLGMQIICPASQELHVAAMIFCLETSTRCVLYNKQSLNVCNPGLSGRILIFEVFKTPRAMPPVLWLSRGG